jgi:hypothetical protein
MVKALVVLFGLALGAGLWLVSPLITGKFELWDSGPASMIIVMAVAGLFLAGAAGRQFPLALAGFYAGQFLAMWLQPHHGADRAPLWMGALLLLLFTLVAAVSAAVFMVIFRKLIKEAEASGD